MAKEVEEVRAADAETLRGEIEAKETLLAELGAARSILANAARVAEAAARRLAHCFTSSQDAGEASTRRCEGR